MSPDFVSSDTNRAQEQLKVLDDLIDALKKVGAEVPSALTETVKALRIATDTGVDLGNACTSASAALAQYTNKVNEDCEVDVRCISRLLPDYSVRVDYVLNWKNKNSVARNFIRATLQRYIPQRICNILDNCKSGE
jgi:hypothetical protein